MMAGTPTTTAGADVRSVPEIPIMRTWLLAVGLVLGAAACQPGADADLAQQLAAAEARATVAEKRAVDAEARAQAAEVALQQRTGNEEGKSRSSAQVPPVQPKAPDPEAFLLDDARTRARRGAPARQPC